MNIIYDFLKLTHIEITRPEAYGTFHLSFLIGGLITIAVLCFLLRKGGKKQHKIVFLTLGILLLVLEIYKQLYFNIYLADTYQWYAFPLQFCSTPMYLALIVPFLKEGKVKKSMLGYLALFAFIAGISVMVHPGDVFMGNLSISLQTMIWHLSLVFIATYIMVTKQFGTKLKDYVYAFVGFLVMICIILVVDIIMYNVLNAAGSVDLITFNMFFISPYYMTTLPVFPAIQSINYFLFLFSYIFAFSFSAFLIFIVNYLLQNKFKFKKEINERN